MIQILFICHGNICRSPMAEFVFRDIVKKRGLLDTFSVSSAATSREEIGNPVYPPVRKLLSQHNIDCIGKTARQVTAADLSKYDYFICMDKNNLRNFRRLFPSFAGENVYRLLDFTDSPHDIADPWYSGDFDTTWEEVYGGCEKFLSFLIENIQ